MDWYDGEDKITCQTLYDFLRLYNFRHYDEDAPSNRLKHNTQTIRIHYGEHTTDWFEFGMYDFGPDSHMEKALKTVINSKLLTHKVTSFSVDDYLNMLNVFLEEE